MLLRTPKSMSNGAQVTAALDSNDDELVHEEICHEAWGAFDIVFHMGVLRVTDHTHLSSRS